MSISFNSIPSNDRVPFVMAEFNASNAQQGPSILAYQGILIGQKLPAGAAAADSVVQISSVQDAITQAGRGSHLHRLAIGWFAANKSTPVFLGVLADAAGGVAATGTIVVGGTATAAGTIALYMGGERITVGVNSGDAAAAIATAIAAAINADADLPVTASAATSTVTVTHRHKGLIGNGYNMRHSFNAGEVLPAGVTLTVTQLASGTTNPTLTNLIAAMAPIWFQIWAHEYTDATSLTAIETELALRFGPTRMMDGLAITSSSGVLSSLTTLGTGRNSPSSVIVAQPGDTPLTPPGEFAAEVAALVAYYGSADPARPFQTLAMSHAIAPNASSTHQWTFDERNTLLFDGIATTKIGPGNVVQLERIITTYQKNAAGAADTAYLDATTMLTLMYLRYDFRNRMRTKYPRHKLADDGAQYGSGQAIMTPKIGKAEAVTWFDDMIKLGLVEDPDQFKRDLVVVRNASDPNRLDYLLPPNLINALMIQAAQIAFLQ